jgi:hypothetical protein
MAIVKYLPERAGGRSLFLRRGDTRLICPQLSTKSQLGGNRNPRPHYGSFPLRPLATTIRERQNRNGTPHGQCGSGGIPAQQGYAWMSSETVVAFRPLASAASITCGNACSAASLMP